MRKNRLAILCLSLLVGFISNLAAQEAAKVKCTGKVVDDLDRPIVGAKVTAYEMHSDGIAGNILLRQVGEVTTAKDGAFIFATTPKPERGVFFECCIVSVKQDLALGWAVWSMREDMESNIRLGKPTKLEGVIVDEAGKPVVGAEVRANLYRTVETTEGEEKREWLPGIAPLQELGTQTNSQGRFLFSNLPVDLGVDLLVTAKGKATTYTYQSAPPEPAFQAGQTDIRVVLPAEARIEGKILDPDTDQGVAEARFAVVATFSGLFYYRFVCTSDNDGTFNIGGLQTGRYLLRGGGLPHTYVNVKSGQTTKVTIRANKLYYGRILFEDGSPVVIKPEPWPGAKTRIELMGEDGTSKPRVGDIDDEGYFTIYLSQKQLQQLQSGKAWFEVLIPYTDKKAYHGEDVFAYDLLATDKSKAGVARIARPERKLSSLVGKPLPELKALNIDLSQTSTQSKMILVCFFDMDQRPSRYCIRELAKRAEELKEKGVTIVAVQASKVDESALNERLEKYSVQFPVGMVQGDLKKTLLSWGVRSLPWLILTNREHIVHAMGFGVNELSEKLRSIDKALSANEIEKYAREVAEAEIKRLGGELVVKASKDHIDYSEVSLLGPRYRREWRGGNWGAKYLNDLANVRKLRIQDVETFTDEGMEHLKGLRSLESLMLVGTGVSDDGLVHLKYLTNLEFLGLMSSRFTDTGLEYIIGMTNLKSLRLDDAQITDEGLRTLKQHRLLTGLEFLVLNRTKITDAGFTHLQGMDQLKWLYFGETQIGDEGMTHLAGLSNLEKIILNNTNVTDAGLAHLKGLKNLNLLYLRNTQVTDAGLEHLRELANLVELGLGCTKITDAGLVHIQGLTNLQSVSLDSTRVTDKGLAYLNSLTALNELFLNQSDITFDGYMDLKEALPNCQIHWEENKGEGAGAARGKTGRKRTEELKSVIVVAAQASKVDENRLNDWLKEYNIPFHVGMVQGDAEKTRFAWGVKSLPWLILTDNKDYFQTDKVEKARFLRLTGV